MNFSVAGPSFQHSILAVALMMKRDADPSPAPVKPLAEYQPPVLERLGPWQAVTLQQSIPIFP